MPITVSASVLKTALGRIGWACEKTTIPILSCFRLTASGAAGSMQIAANNMDAFATVTVPIVEGTGGWETCVNGALLESILKICRGGMVTMDLLQSGLQINNRIVPVLNPVDFPIEETPRPISNIVMPAEMWLKTYERMKFAISTEETRYYLNGIMMESVDGFLRLVATDGHRMAIQVHDVAKIYASGSWAQSILPRWLCAGLAKILRKAKGSVSFAQGKDAMRVLIIHEEVQIVAKLIDGAFPDWERVVPNPATSFTAKNAPFMAALEDVKMPGKGGYAVVMTRRLGAVGFMVMSLEFGSAESAVTGDIVGKPNAAPIGFNYTYLTEIVKILDGAEISIAADNPQGPALITDPADPDYRAVLMPMHV